MKEEGVTRYILTAKKERGTVTGGANFVGWTGGKREEVDASEPPLFSVFPSQRSWQAAYYIIII